MPTWKHGNAESRARSAQEPLRKTRPANLLARSHRSCRPILPTLKPLHGLSMFEPHPPRLRRHQRGTGRHRPAHRITLRFKANWLPKGYPDPTKTQGSVR
jgi:hypothetical protein